MKKAELKVITGHVKHLKDCEAVHQRVYPAHQPIKGSVRASNIKLCGALEALLAEHALLTARYEFMRDKMDINDLAAVQRQPKVNRNALVDWHTTKKDFRIDEN